MGDPLAEALDASGDRERGEATIRRIAAELHRRFGDEAVEHLGRLSRISAWQGLTKNDDGEAEIHDLYGFQLSPSWDTGPEWPVIQPGPTIKAAKPRYRAVAPEGCQTVVVLPDIQCGYFRHPDGQLEPTHDEAAIGVALAIIADVRPHRVVLLGDNLDLPEFGKYRTAPSFALTTQAAINYMTKLMGRLRAALPGEASIDWLAGNHEERIQHWIVDNAKAAFGLRRGADPDGWPVMSIPHLCHLDDHDVTYHPGYPADDLWLSPRLRIIHGDRVQSRGSTAHKYLDAEKVSVLYGHIHRIERAHRTRSDHDGPREIMAASPGCLARIDGVVPSTKQGLDLDGRPLRRHEDWQQGLAVVTVDGESGCYDYEQVRISNGRAWWRGRRYEAD